MMTKKKRRAITISIALIVILLILLVVGILYLKTDLFKSNQVLFAKYMGPIFAKQMEKGDGQIQH